MAGFNGQCEVYLGKFQDPTKSDAMSCLQTDLDDTKIILHNTIEAVLQIDDLVDKSETARKTNRCCGCDTQKKKKKCQIL